MADLKKQTALRLAQEQQQGQALPGPPQTAAVAADPRTKHPVVTPQTLAARRLASSMSHVNPPPPVNREATPVHYQRLHHHSNPVVKHIPNAADAAPALVPPYSSPNYYDLPPQGSKNTRAAGRNGRQAKPGPASAQQAASASTSTGGRYHPNQQSQFLRSAPPPTLPANPTPSNSTGYNTASSNQGGQSSSNSKLPHGLTVHELKEMTKARLQAEAAEKMPSAPSTSAATAEIEARDTFEAGQPNHVQAMHQTQEFDRMSHGSDIHLVSTQVPAKALNYEHVSLGQPTPAQVSPLPPSFQNYGAASSSFGDSSSMDQRTVPLGNRSRVDSFPDSWENASVTSHNSTVASGSESAFSSGIGGGFAQLDEPPGLSLGRTQSYPLGSNRPGGDMLPREGSSNSIPSSLGSGYFDSSGSLGQSRQRAMTLSPRPGLSLLHEDRPGFSDEDLGIPNFSSSRHARQQLTARSRRSFSPVLQHQAFNEPLGGFGSHASGLIGGSLLDNRPRTSSAVSLPAISNTAEEFALDTTVEPSRRSSDSVNTNGPPIIDHRSGHPMGTTDAFLSSSSLYGSSDPIQQSSASSSVFRNDFGRIPAPPGLGGPSRASGADSVGTGSNRARASTWVAGSVSGSDMFGSGGLYEYSGDETLAGDLASILKLSGAEEKSDAGRSGMFQNDISGFL